MRVCKARKPDRATKPRRTGGSLPVSQTGSALVAKVLKCHGWPSIVENAGRHQVVREVLEGLRWSCKSFWMDRYKLAPRAIAGALVATAGQVLLAYSHAPANAQQIDVPGIFRDVMQGAIFGNPQRQPFAGREQVQPTPGQPPRSPIGPTRRYQFSTPPEFALATPTANPRYRVGGVSLGEQVQASPVFRGFKCEPSQLFTGFTWCRKSESRAGDRGGFAVSSSMLVNRNGASVYINQVVTPAFFAPGEIIAEISKISKRFGEKPRLYTMPPTRGVADAFIAAWGSIALEPLKRDEIAILASGGSTNSGLLVDHLADFRQSAKEGLPVYRIEGGAGYLWAASSDRTGRGALRFATADMAATRVGLSRNPSAGGVSPSDSPQQRAEYGGWGTLAQGQSPTDPTDVTPPQQGTDFTPTVTLSKGLLDQPETTLEAIATPSQTVPQTETVEVTGSGDTPEAARADASRIAIQEVVGAFIDHRRRVELQISDAKLSEVVEEQVLSYTNAYVQRFELLSTGRQDGFYTVRARVVVVTAPLISILQKSNIPLIPFDAASAVATVETVAREKRDAIGILNDLLGRISALVSVGVGAPSVRPEMASDADHTWISVPIAFTANAEAIREWRQKFELIAEKQTYIPASTMRPGRSYDGGNGHECLITGFPHDLYAGESPPFFTKSQPQKGQTGVSACFSTARTSGGVALECFGRGVFFSDDQRNEACDSTTQPCSFHSGIKSAPELHLKFVDVKGKPVYVARARIRQYPEVDVRVSRSQPTGAQREFVDHCSSVSPPFFNVLLGWVDNVNFGEMIIFPFPGSQTESTMYILMPNEVIKEISAIGAEVVVEPR